MKTETEQQRIQRELEKAAEKLKRGQEARDRRLEGDGAFARAVRAAAAMPKPVKLVYAELCALPLPRELLFIVHKEITDGTYSVETLEKCRLVDTLPADVRGRVETAIKERSAYEL